MKRQIQIDFEVDRLIYMYTEEEAKQILLVIRKTMSALMLFCSYVLCYASLKYDVIYYHNKTNCGKRKFMFGLKVP